MIAYFLGIPGSGKTYYGVNVIYDNFAKEIPKKSKLSLKKDYENCYTNINEFNYDLVHDVHHFDFDDFYEKIKILYHMYQGTPLSDINDNSSNDKKSSDDKSLSLHDLDFRNLTMSEIKAMRQSENVEKSNNTKKLKKASDAELIEKAKELNIYKTLFVIDECHNFFDTQDKVKVWWLTYHRHLFHDIYLITQSLSLVNAKYKPLAEAFYKAKSSSLTLNKKYFNYMYFTQSRMSKESYVETIKILKSQNVFKLYKSGDKVESKNVILKFIKIAIVLFILLLGLGYYFYMQMSSDIKQEKTNTAHSINNNVAPVSKTHSSNSNYSISKTETDDDFSDKVFLVFKCSYSSCTSKNVSFPPQLIKKFIDMESIHLFYTDKINKNLSLFYVSVSKDFNSFLFQNTGVTNESINTDFSIFPATGK